MEKAKIYFETFGCRIQFGWKALDNLPRHIKKFNAGKAIVVTDEGLAQTGILERIATLLEESGMESIIFQDISPNPTDENIRGGVDVFKGDSCDLIIAVGGGSPIDAAKGIRVLVSHEEPLKQYYEVDGMKKIVNPLPPLIAVPTTAGTGSEASAGAIITDTETNLKRLLISGLPSLSIVDPELTLGLPPFLTAATGMDALTHAIESYQTPRYHPVAEAIAMEGIRLVAENLPTAVEDGSNVEARVNMSMAATMGALSFHKGLGVNHALAHQLSTEYGIQHGLANAILLPHSLAFNRESAEEKIARMALAMGETTPSAEATIQAVNRLNQKIGLPMKMSEVDVREESIPKMAKGAMKDWSRLSNPRPCTEDDMVMLFRNAL